MFVGVFFLSEKQSLFQELTCIISHIVIQRISSLSGEIGGWLYT